MKFKESRILTVTNRFGCWAEYLWNDNIEQWEFLRARSFAIAAEGLPQKFNEAERLLLEIKLSEQ